MGTPKTLIEAIQNGMMFGPISEADQMIRRHVKDYLAQKFGTALLSAKTDDEIKLIKDLWLKVTGEELQ